MGLQTRELQLPRLCRLVRHPSRIGLWLCTECSTSLVETTALFCKRRYGDVLWRAGLQGSWTCAVHLPKRSWSVAPGTCLPRHDSYEEHLRTAIAQFIRVALQAHRWGGLLPSTCGSVARFLFILICCVQKKKSPLLPGAFTLFVRGALWSHATLPFANNLALRAISGCGAQTTCGSTISASVLLKDPCAEPRGPTSHHPSLNQSERSEP